MGRQIILRTQGDPLFNPEAEKAISDACAVHCCDESLTQQHFKAETDINVLVSRFGLDGVIARTPPADPAHYGNVGELPDLRAVLEVAREARDRFAELPPQIRSRFNNDPARLWEFVQDKANHEEAVKLGLLAKHEPEAAPPPPTVIIGNPEALRAPQG